MKVQLEAEIPVSLQPPLPDSIAIRDLLQEVIAPERILIRPIERIAYASDASFYRLIPQAVIQPTSAQER